MSNKNEKSSNGNQSNAENNIFRTIKKTTEQLTAAASRYDERAENGQTIVFIMAEQKKAVGNAANADKDGYLQGIFWSGYVTTSDGAKHDFERLDSNGISRHFSNICTWKRATRSTLLDGNASRTDEERKRDAQKAIEDAKKAPATNSVTALLWKLIESCTWTNELGETMNAETALNGWVINAMENKDTEAKATAQSKETKTAKAKRELEEAKAAAAAAEDTNRKMIAALLATGQYKDENEIREKLGL